MRSKYLIIILFSISTVTSSEIGQVDLQKIFREHEAFSSYNFFVNRFVLIKNKHKLKTDLQLIQNLHLNLLTELDELIQNRQNFNRVMTKRYKNLKSNNESNISSKLISMAIKIKRSNKNHFLKLVELKNSYQQIIDSNFQSSLMSHVDSQNYWKQILSEVISIIDNVRIKKKLLMVIQIKKQYQKTSHFFSEIDDHIINNAPLIFRNILRNENLFSAGFPKLVQSISTNHPIKLIPSPVDISKDIIDEF